MDIFEEIKEAVLSATPGEDTRNYYRNQGMKIEQKRIIKLLEEKIIALMQIESGHGYGNEIMSVRIKTLETAIALIEGNENA